MNGKEIKEFAEDEITLKKLIGVDNPIVEVKQRTLSRMEADIEQFRLQLLNDENRLKQFSLQNDKIAAFAKDNPRMFMKCLLKLKEEENLMKNEKLKEMAFKMLI